MERGAVDYRLSESKRLAEINWEWIMSVAQLVAAIQKLANEKNPGLVQSHVRAIAGGVKEIGDRLAAIEKRLDALDARKG
jgi:hypothetical protein